MVLDFGLEAARTSAFSHRYLPVSVVVETFDGALAIRVTSPFPNVCMCHWPGRTITVQPGSVRVFLGELPPGEPEIVLLAAEGEEL